MRPPYHNLGFEHLAHTVCMLWNAGGPKGPGEPGKGGEGFKLPPGWDLQVRGGRLYPVI